MQVTASTIKRGACTVLATAAITAITAAAHAGGAAESLRSEWHTAVPVTEVNSPAADGCPIESPDGLSLFLASTRPGGFGGNDIWAADRDSVTSPFGAPRNL